MTSAATGRTYRVRAANLAPDSDNKIHDDETARRFGFSAALVPGVEVFAYAVHPLVEASGPAFLQSGAVAIRFRRPVYDGDVVEVAAQPANDGWTLQVIGPNAEIRAVGTAHAPSTTKRDAVDLGRFPVAAMPGQPPPADDRSLAGGNVLGTVEEFADAGACAEYVAAINETSTLYADEGIVHPGILLRMVNASLLRNVELGPWIHTASDCTFLGTAHTGATLSSRAVVMALSSRNGNDYVHYDALVLADDTPVLLAHHTAIYRLAGVS